MRVVSLYGDRVVPRIMNVLLAGREFRTLRARVASSLSGDVLEVGFGSGLNVPYYPDGVLRVLAVDPATVGQKLAAKRVAASRTPVEYIGLDGSRLPLEPHSVDHVLITWTMCTIPDVGTAVGEMHRVLRPGGQLHFVEHGRSLDPAVARRQDRLNALQRLWAGGCNLNRPIDHLIESGGFEMTSLERYYMKGPKPMCFTYEGVATKPS